MSNEYHMFKVGDEISLGGLIYKIVSEYDNNIYVVEDRMGTMCLAVLCDVPCWDGLSYVTTGVVIPITDISADLILKVLKRARC
ncbi:hypothetical protein ARV1_gp06 [Acidianus rod-shaped virus 1]|uniref:Uncharacterized protein n=1 Tax=Acidianus rod-shaped virus 1 TaxID=309181 RepID=Q50I65_9VIRU|nr:hypothetical protein ARV1_gp06 [Acidianus rod-shaped virus 1]CAI44161.1 hypothetical protein [Acidianus rod-shaped virus 1]